MDTSRVQPIKLARVRGGCGTGMGTGWGLGPWADAVLSARR